jgi:hypothetical protein
VARKGGLERKFVGYEEMIRRYWGAVVVVEG